MCDGREIVEKGRVGKGQHVNISRVCVCLCVYARVCLCMSVCLSMCGIMTDRGVVDGMGELLVSLLTALGKPAGGQLLRKHV